jgi:outer membrane lipoprotein-sorting protein
MVLLRACAVLALFCGAIAAAPAQHRSAPPASVAQILARIQGRNPTLHSFQAPIHIVGHVRLLFVPVVKELDGTWYFKRPDRSDVVLNNPPSYLKGIKSFIGDILDPAAWELDSNIAYNGIATVGGRNLLTLRLTKKIYSDQIADTIAYVDPATYEVVREDFHYRDGSTNTMTLTYRNEDGYSVPSMLHGEVHHRMQAVLDATLGEYRMNVAVNDSVFGTP